MANFRNRIIVGIDESGRGPLAGPVMAAAITVQQFSIFNFQFSNKRLKDSKKLSSKKREEIFEFLKKHSAVEWGIGRVSEKVIDKINILEATKLAMERAVNNLTKKLEKKSARRNFTPSLNSCDRKNRETLNFKPGLLLIDGNFGINLKVPQKSIIKGDEKVFLISLASIVAKVTRDRGMLRYHKQFPQYGFACHKGYPTRVHYAMLARYGPCKIHRRTFRGVVDLQI